MIYVNGSSHTEGTGLCDYTLPNYPGDMKTRDTKIIESWSTYRRDFLTAGPKETYLNLTKMNYEKAWPNYAFSSYINKAQGGASIFSICINSIMDISEIISNGNSLTGVYIELPNFERLHLIKNNNVPMMPTEWIRNVTPSHYHDIPPLLSNFFKESWSVRSVEDLLISSLINISHLNSFVHDVLGFYPVYISSGLDIEYCKQVVNTGVTAASQYWLTQSKILDININLPKLHDTGFVADGHYDLAAHIKFGEYIKRGLHV